jgi:hypothetical protein
MFGDIAHPETIRCADTEAAVDEIVAGDGGGVAPRATPRATPVDAGDAGLAHEPLHAFAAHPDALTESQLGVHPRRTVGAPRLAMDLENRSGQRGVLASPR